MIVQVGPYPTPRGGISIYIERMKHYMDHRGIASEVWDLTNVNKNIQGVTNIRFRYIPFKYMIRKDINLIHYNICGVNQKLYIGAFNRMCFRNRKKILTIHGESKDLFVKGNMVVNSLNSFDAIICVKSGDKEYLHKKGVNRPVYEIPAFIFPEESCENIKLPGYITDFIGSKDFIISANASSIQFYNKEDLYGIDMCIDLMERLKIKNPGMIFCLADINNAEYFNKLKKIIRDKKIENKFLLLNEKMELCPLLKSSNLFIRPTNNDGYGVSIAEALYFNTPAIASDVCRRPEGTILFKSRNIADLYEKTIDVIENYTEYKEKLKNIKFQNNAESILEIYEECLRR